MLVIHPAGDSRMPKNSSTWMDRMSRIAPPGEGFLGGRRPITIAIPIAKPKPKPKTETETENRMRCAGAASSSLVATGFMPGEEVDGREVEGRIRPIRFTLRSLGEGGPIHK
jgi:hypothetical protein